MNLKNVSYIILGSFLSLACSSSVEASISPRLESKEISLNSTQQDVINRLKTLSNASPIHAPLIPLMVDVFNNVNNLRTNNLLEDVHYNNLMSYVRDYANWTLDNPDELIINMNDIAAFCDNIHGSNTYVNALHKLVSSFDDILEKISTAPRPNTSNENADNSLMRPTTLTEESSIQVISEPENLQSKKDTLLKELSDLSQKTDDSTFVELKYCFEEITKDMPVESVESIMYGVINGSNIDLLTLAGHLLDFCQSTPDKSSLVPMLQEVIKHLTKKDDSVVENPTQAIETPAISQDDKSVIIAALAEINDSAVYELQYCFEKITEDMPEETLHSIMGGVVDGESIRLFMLAENLRDFCNAYKEYSSYVPQLQEVIDHWPSDVK